MRRYILRAVVFSCPPIFAIATAFSGTAFGSYITPTATGGEFTVHGYVDASGEQTYIPEDAVAAAAAKVVISVVGNTLTWTIDNISPTTTSLFDGDGDPVANAPAIIGFGFDLANATALTLSGWTLTAEDIHGDQVRIDDQVGSPPSSGHWTMGHSLAEVRMDYLPHTSDNTQHDGALYNPEAEPEGNHDHFFTTATLVMTFNEAPVLSSDPKSYFVRVTRIGGTDEDEGGVDGSLKLFADGTATNDPPPPVTVVPEPASSALFGLGLVCSTWMVRRRRRLSV